MCRICRSLILLIAIFSFQFGYSWGITGHRIIAEIAENHLTARSARNLKRIIGAQKLAYWANWPDFIIADTTGVWKPTERWHYVNVPPQNNLREFTESLRNQDTPNIYSQIKILAAQIKDYNTTRQDREIALRFLVHLMGDAAQPMHIGRLEDLGGNKIKINYFGAPTNLHALWDSKLIDSEKYSYSEYARVLDVKSRNEVKMIQSGTLEEWLYDSHRAATTIYAYTVAEQSYSYDYSYRFQSMLERQLLYGGLRLAKVLNDIL